MHIARELMIKQLVKSPIAVLRPTLIYGAGDPHNSYGPNRLRRMAHREGRITLFGEGEETRDHIYIDDVVAPIELVLQLRSSGLLNLASGHSVSYAELAKMVAALCSFPVEIKGSPRQNPITHRAFDVTALHRSFPTFVFTPLKDGLAKAQAVEQSGQFDRSPGGAGGHPVRGKIAKAAKRKVHADRRPDAGAETELYQG